MIDWNKSAELNGMNVDELKSYFDRYPGSSKFICRICDVCGDERNIGFGGHSELCHDCAVNTPEYCKNRSKLSTAQWSDQANRDAQAKRKTQYHKTHPEAVIKWIKKMDEYWAIQANRDAMSEIKKRFYIDYPEKAKNHSEWMIEYCKDPEVNKANSERIINSEAMQIEHENQRGGHDIVNHHWLYDDADLSKYTIPMTRSEHTAMHRRMREDGYEVQHINSDTDDNGLWGYN